MKQHVAFLGPRGTYSEIAARRLFGPKTVYVPCETLDDVVRTAEGGRAGWAVLPIENSTEGSVHRVLDLLADTQLVISAEIVLPIHHCLLGKAKTYADITEVWAHPQALGQCRGWLARHLPSATQHAARSNAEAAQLAAKHVHAVAIAGAGSAELYGLHMLAERIEDNPRNTTRFVAIGTAKAAPTGSDKTSIVCVLPNRAGSLYGLLGIFAKHDINLTKLESRPLPESMWDYRFYIDCDGHANDPPAAAALQEVQAYAVHCRLVGSYPKVEKEE